jgi:hypothetical protein
MSRRRRLLHFTRGPDRHRELATPLQHDQAARIARIQAASTGGICPCLRRVAGCATPTGSAGHASATASLKLTFHLDHSVGANHYEYNRAYRGLLGLARLGPDSTRRLPKAATSPISRLTSPPDRVASVAIFLNTIKEEQQVGHEGFRSVLSRDGARPE